ncbi:type IV pilin-like G/H family protein [Microcoleus sp. B4-D4]|uniref:type IV pilin-like G/H family protein n=1 Tax=Microcoleus sp. B4-D4 TaxID=2818667 RepID=UPI002FD21CB1
MLLTRSIHAKLLQIIPLLSSRFADKFQGKIEGEFLEERQTTVRTKQFCFPSATQIYSNATSGIRSCRNRQRKVAIAAITLPVVFATVAQAQLSPTLKAQESAAKQYVAAMNKGQQAYYANNTGFTSSVANLGLGRIKDDTANYKYSINTGNKAVFNYAVSNQANLKSFVGGVFLVGNKRQTILCVNVAPGKIKPANPTNTNGVLNCAAKTAKIVK